MTSEFTGTGSDDSRLVALSVTDPDQFGAVFDRYFAEIHGYVAKRLGRDVADDVAVETFLTAFRARHRFDPDRGTVRAWLYGIVTNHMSAHRRAEIDGMPLAEELRYASLPSGDSWSAPDGLFSYELFGTPYWTNQDLPRG